jgi:hypothetical protein
MPFLRTAFCLCFLCGMAARGIAVAQSVEQAANELSRTYGQFRAIGCLRIKFFLEYEHLDGQRKFAFNRVDVSTYRKGPRLRLNFVGVRPNGTTLTRELAWDGKVGTSNEPREGGGEYSIRRVPPDLLFYYNYYVEFLSYPDARGSLPKIAKASKGKGVRSQTSWLPEAVTARAGEFIADERRDEEGVACLVLTRPGHDCFWLDPSKGCVLRRRDTWDPATGNLVTKTILRNFRTVGSVWMPATIVREEYGGPDDRTSTPNKARARKTVHLIEVSTAEVADRMFVLDAPPGATVHDAPHRTFFTAYKVGENPVINAAEAARTRVAPSDPTPALVLGAVVMGLLVVAAIVALRAKHFRLWGDERS